MISELAARTFQARNVAHREHWKTQSNSAHVALGAFYDGVIEAIDTIIETYQGMFGRIDAFTVEDPEATDDIVQYLQKEGDWLEENRAEIANGSTCIENLIDSLTAIYCKTIFLLGMK
jgi:hypothetical protein